MYRRLGNVGNRKLSDSKQQKLYDHTSMRILFTVLNLNCRGKLHFITSGNQTKGTQLSLR